ncbi:MULTISPECIES: ABC transporter substrate-binding protein [unclassified Thermotoga]|jgi:multiple sugar transport system substrate-binding protein|uniref:ABC transporter substrate-binding protein n=1 Tax=unclassified Thermotoga TaxID=2631113 RepID=UPI000280E76F|nr:MULTISPECIES: ABC transporter substrate-binding protein [unclassified Thermotoga]AIY86529.1 extracellular solute-binding protein [Thermotoga sp. 2812B]EJX25970.1 extracellular solute-binding protein [Thermotoga sp. EMP]KAF2960763.1 ABC transporter substrate-binding protein [Thermotoga sp. 38H-to]
MKKYFVLLLAVLLVGGLFAVKITMTSGGVGKELEVLKKQLEMFHQQYPDIEVEIIPMPDSSTERHDLYVTYFAAGETDPDVLMLDVIWPAEFAPFLEDLTADKDYFELGEFLPGTVMSVTVNGRIVAVPWFTDAGLLYYRKDLLEKYGYDHAPRTWDELVEMAKKISQAEGIHGFVWQGARYEGLVCDFLEYLWSFGGDVLDESGKVVIDSPEAVAALQFMVDLIYKHKVTPEGVTTYMEEDARRIFQNGEAVFMRNWPYAWSLVNSDESPIKGKVGVAPLPMGPGGRRAATLGGWVLGINKFSPPEEKEAAKKLIKFLTSYDQQLYKAINAGQNPTRKAVYKDPKLKEAAPFMVELLGVFINALPRPRVANYTEVSDVIQRYVHAALTRQTTPEDAIKNIAKELKFLLGQ